MPFSHLYQTLILYITFNICFSVSITPTYLFFRVLQPLQPRCIHAQLSRQRDLATKSRMSTKMLQTTNGKLLTTMLIYKPKGNLHSVAIMIEVTSRRMECTLLTSYYSQMPAVALHVQLIAAPFPLFITVAILSIRFISKTLDFLKFVVFWFSQFADH